MHFPVHLSRAATLA